MRQRVDEGAERRQQSNSRQGLYYGWMVAAASFLIVLLNTGVQQSFGNFLKPMSAEFGWDRATASLPAAVAILMNGLFQPFVGQLVDRFGPRRVITLSLVLLSCSTAAIAAATGVGYLTIVYGVFFALGLSGAGNVPHTTLVAHWFVRQRGRVMGFVNAGASVGQLLIIPASMALLLWSDWRTTYLVLAAALLLGSLPLSLLVLRNDPSDLGLRPDGAEAPPAGRPAEGQPLAQAARAPLEPTHWRGAFATTPMWLLMGEFFVCGFTLSVVSTHFVSFVTDRGISPAVAATALGLVGGFNIVGTLLAGTASDYTGRKNPLALVYFVRAASFAFLLSIDAPWALYVFAAMAGLSWFATVPLTVSLAAEIYGMRHMGTLVGLVFASHQVGGALSIYLAGWLFDLTGSYTTSYLMSIAVSLVGGMASFAIQERRYSLKYLAMAKA
jgi:MFS family permease